MLFQSPLELVGPILAEESLAAKHHHRHAPVTRHVVQGLMVMAKDGMTIDLPAGSQEIRFGSY